MKLSDPLGFCNCLSHNGGMTGLAVVLVHEQKNLGDVFVACSAAKCNDKGSSRVCHIQWKAGEDNNRIHHRHFTDLTTKFLKNGFKDMDASLLCDQVVSIVDAKIDACVSISKRNRLSSHPNFLPDKCGSENFSAFVADENCEKPPTAVFAGRLCSSAANVHARGLATDQASSLTANQIDKEGAVAEKEEADINSLLSLLSDSTDEEACVTEQSAIEEGASSNHRKAGEVGLQFNHCWAIHKHKTWMTANDEVTAEIKRMCDCGKGHSNEGQQCTAEQASMELRETFMMNNWDQKVGLTSKTLESKFGQWCTEEKKASKVAAQAAEEAAARVADAEVARVEAEDGDDEGLMACKLLLASAINNFVDGVVDAGENDVTLIEDFQSDDDLEEDLEWRITVVAIAFATGSNGAIVNV